MTTILDTSDTSFDIDSSSALPILFNTQIGATAAAATVVEDDSGYPSLFSNKLVNCSEQAIPRPENKFHKFDLGGNVEGQYESKYKPVVDALKENLSLGRDKGCQLVIIVNNKVVVDLVSRSPSEKQTYNADTVQNIFR